MSATLLDPRRFRFSSFGDVEATVTRDGAVVEAWVRLVQTLPPGREDVVVVGLACERRPNNVAAATLRLCVGPRCLIIQLTHLGPTATLPGSLVSFLLQPHVVCVGVDVDADVAKLRARYGIDDEIRTFDILAQALSLMPYSFAGRPSLKKLASGVLGISVPKLKHVEQSNWEKRDLDDDQVKYACFDAYACFHVGTRLQSMVKEFDT